MPARPAQRNPFRQFVSTAAPGEELANARRLPLDLIDINPHQSRQQFDETSLKELAASIREHDVLQPIGVIRVGTRYQILFGERRFRAAAAAEKTDIPTIIFEDMNEADAAILTALENLQREDLDIEDEARQFAYLLQATGLSLRKLGSMLGVDHRYIWRRVKLLERPDLMDAYRSGEMNLHSVVARVGAEPDDEESSEVHALKTVPLEDSSDPIEDVQLIEREDMPGYIVSRGDSFQPGKLERGTPFRWRPALHFRNWLVRTAPDTIPVGERASFKAQIAEIKGKLEEWERALEAWELSGEKGDSPKNSQAVETAPGQSASADDGASPL